jgi:hypothetical protein
MSNVTESLDDDVLQLQTAQDTSGDDVIRDEMVKGTVVLRRLHLFESWDVRLRDLRVCFFLKRYCCV